MGKEFINITSSVFLYAICQKIIFVFSLEYTLGKSKANGRVENKLSLGNLSLSELLAITENIKNWYSLGVELSISTLDLKLIEVKHKNDNDKAKEELFIKWLQSDNSASWEKVGAALHHLGYYDTASLIRKKHASKSPIIIQICQGW